MKIENQNIDDDSTVLSLEWKDFFGSSLDLSQELLPLYDLYSLKNSNELDLQNCRTVMRDKSGNYDLSREPCYDYAVGEGRYNQIYRSSDHTVGDDTFHDNVYRPSSISSVSSASSNSLQGHVPMKMNCYDIETSSSGVDTCSSRSSCNMATGRSSSNVSVETANSCEDYSAPADDSQHYDSVYDESAIHYDDKNIYETVGLSDKSEYVVDENQNLSKYHNFSSKTLKQLPYEPDPHLLNDCDSSCIFYQRGIDNCRYRNLICSQSKKSECKTQAERVAEELIETEKLYVKDLYEIIHGYMKDAQLSADVSISDTDRGHLFGNLTDIYQFNRKLLNDLADSVGDPVRVALCFVTNSPGFTIYSTYCNNYPKSMEVLARFMSDGDISEIFRRTQSSLGHGLALGAYLLKPVQRILKYHLLFQNIMKSMDESSAGYETVREALTAMTAMASSINEMKRRHERAVRVQEIGSQFDDYSGPDLTTLGDLILEDSFRIVGAKVARQAFLFEHALLIAKKKELGMMSCKVLIMCKNLMLVESLSKEPLSFNVIPFDQPKMRCTLVARDFEMKHLWCHQIKTLILGSYDKIPEKAKNLVLELGRRIYCTELSENVCSQDVNASEKFGNFTKNRRKSSSFIDFNILKNRKGIGKKSSNSEYKLSLPYSSSEVHELKELKVEKKDGRKPIINSKSFDDISRLRVKQTAINVENSTCNHMAGKCKLSTFKQQSADLTWKTSPIKSSEAKYKSIGSLNRRQMLCIAGQNRNSSEISEGERSDLESDMEVRQLVSHSEMTKDLSNNSVRLCDLQYTQINGRNSINGDNTNGNVGHRPLTRVVQSASLGNLPSKHLQTNEGTRLSIPIAVSPISSNSSSYENLKGDWQHACSEKLLNTSLRKLSSRPASWCSEEIVICEDYDNDSMLWEPAKDYDSSDELSHPALKNIVSPYYRKSSPNIYTGYKNKIDWIMKQNKLLSKSNEPTSNLCSESEYEASSSTPSGNIEKSSDTYNKIFYSSSLDNSDMCITYDSNNHLTSINISNDSLSKSTPHHLNKSSHDDVKNVDNPVTCGCHSSSVCDINHIVEKLNHFSSNSSFPQENHSFFTFPVSGLEHSQKSTAMGDCAETYKQQEIKNHMTSTCKNVQRFCSTTASSTDNLFSTSSKHINSSCINSSCHSLLEALIDDVRLSVTLKRCFSTNFLCGHSGNDSFDTKQYSDICTDDTILSNLNKHKSESVPKDLHLTSCKSSKCRNILKAKDVLINPLSIDIPGDSERVETTNESRDVIINAREAICSYDEIELFSQTLIDDSCLDGDARNFTTFDDISGTESNASNKESGKRVPPETLPKPRLSVKQYIQRLEGSSHPVPHYLMDAKNRLNTKIQEHLKHLNPDYNILKDGHCVKQSVDNVPDSLNGLVIEPHTTIGQRSECSSHIQSQSTLNSSGRRPLNFGCITQLIDKYHT